MEKSETDLTNNNLKIKMKELNRRFDFQSDQ